MPERIQELIPPKFFDYAGMAAAWVCVDLDHAGAGAGDRRVDATFWRPPRGSLRAPTPRDDRSSRSTTSRVFGTVSLPQAGAAAKYARLTSVPMANAYWATRDQLCGFRSFNPTSMCAYSNDLDRTLWSYFENSTRAIDSPKNQPNRL